MIHVPTQYGENHKEMSVKLCVPGLVRKRTEG